MQGACAHTAAAFALLARAPARPSAGRGSPRRAGPAGASRRRVGRTALLVAAGQQLVALAVDRAPHPRRAGRRAAREVRQPPAASSTFPSSRFASAASARACRARQLRRGALCSVVGDRSSTCASDQVPTGLARRVGRHRASRSAASPTPPPPCGTQTWYPNKNRPPTWSGRTAKSRINTGDLAYGPCRNRTCNLGLKRPLLCQLS